MLEKGLTQRLLLIAAVLIFAIVLITPPSKKLRPGLDIAGGVSMIFEIDQPPGEVADANVAEELKRQLQKRIDPSGVLDIVWRVIGTNRIEVQMPLPPKANAALRKAYLQELTQLNDSNISRGVLDVAVGLPAEERSASLARLAGGNTERAQLLQEAASAWDGVVAARLAASSQPATQSAPSTQASADEIAVRDALEAYENVVDRLRATNLDMERFRDLLEQDENSKVRARDLERLKADHPALAAQIDKVVAAHKLWNARRVPLESPDDLRRLVRGAGVLEFRILSPMIAENMSKYERYRKQLHEFGPRRQKDDTERWFKLDNPVAFLTLNSQAELSEYDPKSAPYFVVDKHAGHWYVLADDSPGAGLLNPRGAPDRPQWQLTRAGVSRDERGRRAVHFELDNPGGDLFRKLTGSHINRQLCILLDDVAYSSANIITAIGTSGQITGDFSTDKLNYLVQTMQAGALPARLKDTPISERTIGSSLGQRNLELAFRAGLIGMALVVVTMVGYYRFAGVIASLAMLINVLFTLAAMAMLEARFNLPGIAGVILGIGMAVDSNVLIYERMREERERGSSLRMIIKNGYDKAFSTIFDSHVTTLLTCVILYYAGSEEIKGFGLTLGWGVVLNLFTAVFVTRTMFGVLVKYGLIKDLKMAKFMNVPKIDWYGMRKFFVPLSIVLNIVGLLALYARGARDTFDVEFLGGVNAEIEVKPEFAASVNDVTIRTALRDVGLAIESAGRRLAKADVSEVAGSPGTYRIALEGVKAAQLAAMLAEPLEDGESGQLLQRDGVSYASTDSAITVRVKPEVTADALRAAVARLAESGGDSIPLAGADLQRANIGAVLTTGDQEATGGFWNVTTTVTNKRLVQYALVEALGDKLVIQPRLAFTFRGNGAEPYPITERRLAQVVPDLPARADADVSEYVGGAAMFFDNVDPPDSLARIEGRIESMRLQPDFQNLAFRTSKVIGVEPVDGAGDLYRSFVVVVPAADYPYQEDRELWSSEVAVKELILAKAAFNREQTLRKATQFKPQIAAQAQTKAIIALMLSWAMIIIYLWIRFGKPSYGTAGVVALVHDVCVALSAVGVAGWLPAVIAGPLLIEDFKIDMTTIAALLTIIGFSINDTIVIFDRIRELRGRLGVVTAKMINDAVNQTLTRSIITMFTVFIVLLAMYVFGGSSVRGFNYCMLFGVLTGCYSSIAIAAPLLLFRVDDYVGRPAGKLATT